MPRSYFSKIETQGQISSCDANKNHDCLPNNEQSQEASEVSISMTCEAVVWTFKMSRVLSEGDTELKLGVPSSLK